MKAGTAIASALGLCLSVGAVLTAHAEDRFAGEIRVRTIETFAIGRQENRFGPFEFVGGLEMTSALDHFGALSSFRFTDGGRSMIGVADTGFWFAADMERDGAGKPSGLSGFVMAPIPDTKGRLSNRKWETDAESIAIADDGRIAVGFERVQRITEYVPEGAEGFGSFRRNLDLVIPEYEFRANRGYETLAFAPSNSTLAGALVGITEKSIDKDGNIFAAVLTGPGKGIFKVARSDSYDITDGDFLPDGDLLILERRFSMAEGVGMRVRKIRGADIRAGAVIDGEVLMEADLGYQIDNMEGLDVWQGPDGSTMVSMISDDNHSLLQRNLYLEFRLVE